MTESDSAGTPSALTEAIPGSHRAERTTESSARGFAALNEAELVALAKAGDGGAFRVITQRCNQRLFRIARSVLKDDGEAEDAVQEAYASAFLHMGSFRGDARLLTWLSRITLNEARGRLRRKRNTVDLGVVDHSEPLPSYAGPSAASPEAETARGEARCLIERAIDNLPESLCGNWTSAVWRKQLRLSGCAVPRSTRAFSGRAECFAPCSMTICLPCCRALSPSWEKDVGG
jgi:RNA polymerase sigma factor (sigma-70 family)